MKHYIIIALTLILCLLSIGGSTATSSIDYNKDIRVGLKSLYEKVDSIHINNQSLILGYELNSDWTSEYVMSSNSGYTIKPAAYYFLVSEQYFETVDDCLSKVKALNSKGYQAYAGNASPGIWKVYVGDASTESEAQSILNQVESLEGLNYEIVKDNGLRTFLTNQETTLILENSYAHSSFKTNDIVKGVSVIDLGDRSYRGMIEVGRYNKSGVTAINIVSLEDYLYGVVASEMPSSWPKEALKAQAVATRSFAVYYAYINKKYTNEPYTICDTVTSQVYKGFNGESTACNQAVNETYQKIIYYGESVIPANFFSTSGGHTEDSQNVWSGTVGYLKAVPDIYETEPAVEPWVQSFTASEVKSLLAKNNVNIGNIVDIQVTDYTSSGRAMALKVIGTSGEHELVKETMRAWLGLKSRKFTLITSSDQSRTSFDAINSAGVKNAQYNNAYVMNSSMQATSLNLNNNQLIAISGDNIHSIPTLSGKSDTFIFVGQGSGHGVGMSQSGAKGMALQGFTYKEILEYYYTGTVVK